jgi:hypothetical protein
VGGTRNPRDDIALSSLTRLPESIDSTVHPLFLVVFTCKLRFSSKVDELLVANRIVIAVRQRSGVTLHDWTRTLVGKLMRGTAVSGLAAF